jgi:uncharacterized protein YjdB
VSLIAGLSSAWIFVQNRYVPMRHFGAVRFFIGATTGIFLAACGGGGGGTPPSPSPITYTAASGVAQKGPLIKGSTVVAQELDAKLSPTGKQYSYQITSDLGTFSPTSTFGSQYIGLNATGYYFDEIANSISSGTVTLNGYSDLTTGTALNVNLLTTLAYQRIQHLVTNSNMTFAAAATQAENEVLAALNIPASNYGSFGAFDLAGSTDGDHILAAISSMFVYGNSAGTLSSLIANFQSDIGANGVITVQATSSALLTAAKALNPAAVAANLTQEYSSVGITFTAANIAEWIDQDGDGVIGKFKFQVADATPSTLYTFQAAVVTQVAGTSVSVGSGQLFINGTLGSGATTVKATDSIAVSPGPGTFPNGVANVYLLSGGIRIARVSFVSGLLSIAVTPPNPSLPKGLTQQLSATGTFSDASTADMTNNVAWTSGSPSVAIVNAVSELATSVAVGSSVILATSGSVSGSTTLNVTPAVVESITIAPNPAVTGIGLPKQLSAMGSYSDGTTANVTNVAKWTSSDTTVATVGPTTGLVVGVATGSASVLAAIGSVGATVPISVLVNSWAATGSLATPRASPTATLLPDGTVLAVSGGTAELYNPVSSTWTVAGNVGSARGTATLLQNGKVLVVGGAGALGLLNDADLYDPATGTWSATGSLSTPRALHTATLLPNGKVLVVGGYGMNGGSIGSAELYDPVAGGWSTTGGLAAARNWHTATLLPNGKVLVTGGTDMSATGGTPGYLASAELYDPVAGTWSTTGNLGSARFSHTATLLGNGQVLVAGGASATSLLSSAELYDPVVGTWSATGTMGSPRNFFTAVLLPNGTVLVAGGNVSNSPFAGVELYDPVTRTWAATGNLVTARSSHAAALLQNGLVMVLGGVGVNNGALVSAELYY